MAFLSVVKLLKGALMYSIVTIVLSSIQLSGLQSQDASKENMTNESILDPACDFVENRSCSHLPAVCVTCEFFQDGLPQCNYNENTTFPCWPLEDVMCEVGSFTSCVYSLTSHNALPINVRWNR